MADRECKDWVGWARQGIIKQKPFSMLEKDELQKLVVFFWNSGFNIELEKFKVQL